jgi:hypothetical protein
MVKTLRRDILYLRLLQQLPRQCVNILILPQPIAPCLRNTLHAIKCARQLTRYRGSGVGVIAKIGRQQDRLFKIRPVIKAP